MSPFLRYLAVTLSIGLLIFSIQFLIGYWQHTKRINKLKKRHREQLNYLEAITLTAIAHMGDDVEWAKVIIPNGVLDDPGIKYITINKPRA